MARHVLFLGAGFSRPFGLPTMGEFFRHVRTLDAISQEDKTWLEDLLRRANQTAGMLLGQVTNLEHVLSLAMMRRESLIRGTDPGAPSNYQRIARVLRTVYRALAEDRIAKQAKRVTLLLRFGLDGEEPPTSDLSIITTNYDLAVEYCVYRLGARCRLPITWERCPTDPGQNSESLFSGGSGPLLCKLHGSVNWFWPRGPKDPIRVDDRVAVYQRLDPRMESFPYPVACDPKCAFEDTPLLVPPMYFKHQPDARLDASWEAAAAALADSERLAFVGYSFPKSDSHMAYFLAAALNENPRLEGISIIDPDARAICERLGGSDFGSHFKSLLRPIGTPWHESNYGFA